MTSAGLVGLTAAIIIEYVVGIALNLYILLVYIGNLKNGLSLGPSDKIHFMKALVNVCMQALMILQNIIYFLPNLLFIRDIVLFFIFSNLFIVVYNSWLTALLCVYYCTNITSQGHHNLAWLKRSFSSYLLRILLVSGLGSLVICSSILWIRDTESAGNSTRQSTNLHGTILPHTRYRIIPAILGSFIPFSIAFISTMLTSWSLINHMWRMKQNNTRSKLQTQITATRTMILFLLSSLINNVALFFYFNVTPGTSDIDALIIWIFIIFYLISEAIIIIQSSVKLRRNLVGQFLLRASSNQEAET